MQFTEALVPGRLIRRYKRFLADIALGVGGEGETVTAHCPNPGAMLGLQTPGNPVWLRPIQSATRKLPFALELVALSSIENEEILVGINTNRPNALAREAIESGRIAELAGYESIRAEVRYGTNSRIDLLLEAGGRPPCYVEIKNVHFRRTEGGAPLTSAGGLAEFPDSVTSRGTKHLGELAAVAASGGRAVMLYIVQRGDCDRLTTAPDMDPAYDAALRKAVNGGVEALCYDCHVDVTGIAVRRRLDIVL